MAGGLRDSIGAPVRRREDPRLIAGRGRYVDDIPLPGVAHAAFVRSIEAHGLVREIDASDAAALPGVLGVFTAGDLSLSRPMPNVFPAPFLEQSIQAPPLAVEEVCYVGEPVAVVVAESRYVAADAASLVRVEYESLPPVVDHDTALDAGSRRAHRGLDTNLVATLQGGYGDVDDAFAGADHVVELDLRQHRGACASLEPRGVAARWDAALGQLIVWSSTQSPHPLRRHLAGYLGMAHGDVRVITPDVGGGFGPKAPLYAEEYVVAALARSLGRPVKWVETRREHFVATLQQRDQTYRLQVATDRAGRLRGLRGRVVHDNGAYVPYGVILPVTGLLLTPGPYVLPAMELTIDIVYTNKTPTSPIRGAGRPYAVFAIERAMDAIASRVGIDRAEVRRRNFVPSDAFPYEQGLRARDGSPIMYDSGDYHANLEAVLAAADWDGFEARRAAATAAGKHRGIGVASYVEDTGLGPFEGARVEVLPSGDVVVETGAASQGQGHATVVAQLCSEALGVDVDRVTVRGGDTAGYGYGISTVASRTAIAAGSSVHIAASRVADRARELAAARLEAAVDDLLLVGGYVQVAGDPGARVSLGDLAASVQGVAAVALPEGSETPGLAAEAAYQGPQKAYAFGSHVVEVEVDPETGSVEVVRYVAGHDCGSVLNPMIVEGQIHGGVVHGLGNALSERVAFDEWGQPLAVTFMDYRIPAASDVPPLELVHTVTPAPGNPLGVKGAGEGGTLPAAAAVISAVEDALSVLGPVFVDRHPLSAEHVHGLIASTAHREEPAP